MAPRRDDTSAEPAAEPTPPDAMPVKRVDLFYLFNGDVCMCTDVDVTKRAFWLRIVVKEDLNLPEHPKMIKISSLRKPDGSWPTQAEACSIQGTEVKYTLLIKRQFPVAVAAAEGEVDAIHFRVEVPEEQPARGRVRAPSAARAPVDDGDATDVEVNKENVSTAAETSHKRKAGSDTLPFHMFDDAAVSTMYKGVKTDTYTQREQELPQELWGDVQKHYKNTYNSTKRFE